MNQIEKQNKLEREKYVILIANKIRERNFDNDLRKQHNEFINSQLEIAENFYKNLAREKGGIKKVIQATGLSENQVRKICLNQY